MRSKWWVMFVLVGAASALCAQDHSVERRQVGWRLVVRQDERLNEAICIACTIENHGTVGGNAVAVGGDIENMGAIQGDAVSVGGDQTLLPGSQVGGDALAVGGHIRRDPLATVSGEATAQPFISGLPLYGPGALMVVTLVPLAGANLLLALLAYAIFGWHRVENMAGTLHARPLLSLATGIVVTLAALLLYWAASLAGRATLATTIVISVLLFVTTIVGYTGVSSWLGHALHLKRPLAALLAGAVLIAVFQTIPYFGLGLYLLFTLLALGAAVLTRLGGSTRWLPRVAAAAAPAEKRAG